MSYERRLTCFDATMVVVGGIIGAGIFLNPAIVAQRVGSPGLVLAAWAVGGAVALVGALLFGELGARRPEAGGGYVYLREAFGPLVAFLYGWTLLLVINTGGVAAVAVTFARYTADVGGWGAPAVKPLAVGAIVLLSGISYRGVRAGAITQNVFTLLKLAALAVLIGTGLFFVQGPPAEGAAAGEVTGGWGALGAALVPVLFAYGGWQHANHVAGEVRRPARNLPRALLGGVGLVVAVYLLANVAYLRALGAEGLAASLAPASDTLRRAFGEGGARLIALGIAASTFGFLNLAILAAPRVYQAMAADGLFFGWAARLHPRYHTPGGAIAFQAAWAVGLTLTGTYGQLLDYVVFGDWIFFGLVAATLFVFRRREAEAPFQAPMHPWLPLLFCAAAAYAVASAVASNPRNALAGAALILLGLPVYAWWRRRAPRR